MKKIPDEVIQDWISKKKYIQDKLNRINKRLKKFTKQKNHFEFRLKMIQKAEKNVPVVI